MNLANPKGAALLVPNQYINCWKLGLHQGKYEALRQSGLLKIYRDSDRDTVYDYENIADSLNDGINIHKAGLASVIVDGWSAGCQVLAKTDEYEIFMDLCS